jgi:D-glycero-alpha-D-manno-heptose-7-phosphate kinase
VQVEPVVMPPGRKTTLQDNLCLFYLGGARAAGSILAEQQDNIHRDKRKAELVVRMAELAQQLRISLVNGEIGDMGPILDENWHLKKQLSGQISDHWIDSCYDTAKQNGATGGKLLGAGGGGFLLFYCEKQKQDKLRASLGEVREMKFIFDSFGTQVIHYEENKVW